MALGSHQRTLTALLLVLFAICLLLFGESLGGLGGLFQLQGNVLTSSSYAVAERHKQRAKHVKEVGYIIDFFGIKSPYHNGPMVLRHWKKWCRCVPSTRCTKQATGMLGTGHSSLTKTQVIYRVLLCYVLVSKILCRNIRLYDKNCECCPLSTRTRRRLDKTRYILDTIHNI